MKLSTVAAISALLLGLAAAPAMAQTGGSGSAQGGAGTEGADGQPGASGQAGAEAEAGSEGRDRWTDLGTADLDGDGMISVDENMSRAEMQFDAMRGDSETLDRDRFGARYGVDAEVDTMYGSIDVDQSGDISRDEYLMWRDDTYGAATTDGGDLDIDTYGEFEAGGPLPPR